MSEQVSGGVRLLWIPLGAGQRVVRISGRCYEALRAAMQRRPRRDLYHTALLIDLGDARYAIEVAPIVDGDPRQRGVVAEGPVGLRPLGRFRLFRYEVRCRSDAVIPDLDAVALTVDVPIGSAQAAAMLDLVRRVPTPVWGRDELDAGDMWNSNSVVAWLLASVGAETTSLHPPGNGRAPGWDAGLAVARTFGSGDSVVAVPTLDA